MKDAKSTDGRPTFQPNNRGPAPNVKRDYTSRSRAAISWAEAHNQELRDTIVAVTDVGAAVLLGRTSDGGALSLSVLDGDQRIKEYLHSAEEISETLRWLVRMFSSD